MPRFLFGIVPIVSKLHISWREALAHCAAALLLHDVRVCRKRSLQKKRSAVGAAPPDHQNRDSYFFSLLTPLKGLPSILLSMNCPFSLFLLTQRPVLGFRTWLRCLTAPLRWPSPIGGFVAIIVGLYACSLSGIVRSCPRLSDLTWDWAISGIGYIFPFNSSSWRLRAFSQPSLCMMRIKSYSWRFNMSIRDIWLISCQLSKRI